MSRFRLFGALLLASSAALGACTLVDGSEDTSSELTDPSTQTCLRDTIEVCYAQELTPEVCAALIEANCLGGGPGPGDPDDPGCVEQVFQDCLASGVDEMTCWALAHDQCNQDPGDPPCDPPPDECDPATGMNCPPPDCDPMTDPNCWPPPPPDCGPNGMDCPPPDCDPMTDPGCWPPPPDCGPNGMDCPPPDCDPMTDPSCWPPPPPDCGPNGMDCPPEPPPCNDPGCNGMP